jgi:hypothetical protein
MIAVPRTTDAKPPGSCDPWPDCKEGDDGSGDAPAFSENCQNLNQLTVTGNWSVSRGECSAKNTDAEHIMVTTSSIDLSGALEAYLSYKYRIDNADVGEYMSISVSSNDGTSLTDLKDYFGSESGTVKLNLADLGVELTSAMKLRASCFVSANNEVCAWDNIKIESVSSPPGELLVTIDSPMARTYGAADFPLTYKVTLSQMGTAEYSLNDGPHILMTSDEGSSGTVHTAVENALSNGAYSFQVFAIDDLGYSNNTQSVVFSVDTLAPAVEFVDPTPTGGSSQSSSEIPV